MRGMQLITRPQARAVHHGLPTQIVDELCTVTINDE